MTRRLVGVAAVVSSMLLAGFGPPEGPATPKDLATNYYKLLAADKPYSAVDECLDLHVMAERVLGRDFAGLDAGRAAYVEQLFSVAIKATLSAAHLEKVLPTATHTPFAVTENGDEARVTFTMTYPAALTGAEDARNHQVEMVMHRGANGWRIVDLKPVVSVWKSGYAQVKREGMGPVEYAETLSMTMVQEKAQPGGAAAALEEAKAGNIQTQLDTLNNQIELFRARTGAYPDFTGQGWKQLVEGGYLRSAPVNPENNRSEVCVAPAEREGFGWFWDPKAQLLGATGFDANTGRMTHPSAPQPQRRMSAIERYKELSTNAKISTCKGTLGGVRSGIANFYANEAVNGKAKFPTLVQLQTPGAVMTEAMQANPFNGSATIAAARWNAKQPVGGTHGWNYDETTGRLWANTAVVGENEW